MQCTCVFLNSNIKASDYLNFTNNDIPLIARGFLQDCNMTVKIGNAIANGAKAAVIYFDPGTISFPFLRL